MAGVEGPMESKRIGHRVKAEWVGGGADHEKTFRPL